MSDLNKKINAADIDAALTVALKDVEKSMSEKTISLEKSVDKRAMGGDQKDETGCESIANPGDDRKGLPKVGAGERAVSKLKGNWAERYPMDAAVEENLEGAIKNSAKAPTREKTYVNKSVEESAEPHMTEKAVGEDSLESKEPMHKAVGEDQSDESSSIVKAADASSSSSSSASKSKKFDFKKKMKKSAVPAEQSASASGAESGAPQLKKSMKLVASAKKHLAKAYEGGSDTELDIAGNRLAEAKDSILKAIKSGEPVTAELVKSINKAAKYFGKALEAFEFDKIEDHCKSVEKSTDYMSKCLNAYDFQKSTTVEKSVTGKNEITFTNKNGKVVAEMTEAQFKQVSKVLGKEGLYKSFLDNVSKEQKATIDAVPVLKSLVSSLKESQDSLRDNLVSASEKDAEFKKSIASALNILAQASTQNASKIEATAAEVAAVKNEPKVRKSIVTEIESPLAEVKKSTIDVAHIGEILLKGMSKGMCNQNVVLAWDVDKDMPEQHKKYIDLCEKIQRS